MRPARALVERKLSLVTNRFLREPGPGLSLWALFTQTHDHIEQQARVKESQKRPR